ncbi:MAG: cache domain-containing protein [Chloroflexota bacterium]
MKKWLQGSFARAILLALLIISIVPIALISTLFINQSTAALTAQMEANLQMLAQSKAEEINLKLNQVLDATQIAARQAAFDMQREVSSEDVDSRMARYRPDGRNILGLDVYYQEAGGETTVGNKLSNVYWNNNTPLSDKVRRDIVVTEGMDATFESIKAVSPETQWIYLTTPEGMMRLYPWASNDNYPDGWDPREVVFYTVADRLNNPSLVSRWTPPYVDFAGAGWMVTLSTPILGDKFEFMGVMSHDVTIQSLKDIALDINVLDGAGYGFLVDHEGGVIAHPLYEATEAAEGTQETVNLLEVGSPDYQALMAEVVDGGSGQGSFRDEQGENQLLVYAPIPSIGWSLGIVVPEQAVVAPAVAMRGRVLLISLALLAAAVLLAVVLARQIHRPLTQLATAAQQLSEERRPDEIQMDSFHELTSLARAFNDMAAKVWERERRLKRTVAELRIEIDAKRTQKQVSEISETEYFKHLETNAERIRQHVRGRDGSPAAVKTKE